MLDITAETKKVREDMEKQGYVLTEEEYQIILEYTIRKSDRCGKGRDYVPLLLEDEIKNYYFRNTPLELKGRGIKKDGVKEAKNLRPNYQYMAGWFEYTVTERAFEKLQEQYTISQELLLD